MTGALQVGTERIARAPFDFARNLYHAMQTAGLTMEQLAERADVAPIVVYRIMRADADPRLSLMAQLAAATGAPLSDMLVYTPPSVAVERMLALARPHAALSPEKP